jgi:hypothetical protein
MGIFTKTLSVRFTVTQVGMADTKKLPFAFADAFRPCITNSGQREKNEDNQCRAASLN